MDIGGYSTVAALRGEVGASLMKSRIMETTLQYVRSVMNSGFENIREMMLDTIQVGQGYWFKNVNAYRLELDINWVDLFNMTSMELKRRVRE